MVHLINQNEEIVNHKSWEDDLVSEEGNDADKRPRSENVIPDPIHALVTIDNDPSITIHGETIRVKDPVMAIHGPPIMFDEQ